MNNYQEYTVRVYRDRTDRVYMDRTEWRNKDGHYHRVGGPAIECADGSSWYLNGQHHRVDGPAIEFADGSKRWYLNGKPVSEAEHARQTAKPVSLTSEAYAGKVIEIDGKKYRLTAV